MRAHWIRTGLTLSALVVALFLFCFLVSIVTSAESAVKQSASNRLVVQSAVSLFVNLPTDYQPKIAGVPGVESVCKFQWFGGFYQNPDDFFAQFAVDHDIFFEQYERDFKIIEGPNGASNAREDALAAMAADRRATVVGKGLMDSFPEWEVGKTVPITGTIFQKPGDAAWEFLIVGVYEPLKSNVDDRTMWFRYDYLDETLRQGGASGPIGTGTYMLTIQDGIDVGATCGAVDALFENGPQKTLTSTEAAFQAGFVSMLGNLPLFMGTIGGAVVFAVFFSVVNTMLMAGRQRIRESGVLKALGFRSSSVARVMFVESVVVSLIGGAIGCGLAFLLSIPAGKAVEQFFPNFTVEPTTVYTGIGIALVIGIVAGLGPAFTIWRLQVVDALRSQG